MGIKRTETVARADMNDEFGVTLWQARKVADYTITEARELAAELIRAANEAERIAQDDAWASEGQWPPGFDFDVDLDVETVTPAMAAHRAMVAAMGDGSPYARQRGASASVVVFDEAQDEAKE